MLLPFFFYGSFDPAAAEQTLAAIKYRSLPRRYCRKCFFKNYFAGVVRTLPDRAGNRRRAVADLHFRVDASIAERLDPINRARD